MTFAWALREIANGRAVQRAAWAGKYLVFDASRGEVVVVVLDAPEDGVDLITERGPEERAAVYGWKLNPDRFERDWIEYTAAPVNIATAPAAGGESLL